MNGVVLEKNDAALTTFSVTNLELTEENTFVTVESAAQSDRATVSPTHLYVAGAHATIFEIARD